MNFWCFFVVIFPAIFLTCMGPTLDSYCRWKLHLLLAFFEVLVWILPLRKSVHPFLNREILFSLIPNRLASFAGKFFQESSADVVSLEGHSGYLTKLLFVS